jgi:hypothetical protein
MSFVIATPDLVQGAAQDVAGIGSSLAQVSSAAAGPTTGIAPAAQDEVSLALASLFGNVGHEFQALSAQAQAFHAEFVSAMNGSAAAYVSAEAAAGQTLTSAAAAPAQALFGGGAAMVTGQGAATMAQGIGSFGAAVAAPYQQLVINTSNNLAAINQTFMANPFPFLTQVMSNQTGFAQTFGAGLATSLQGFPGNLPANIQLAIQGASTFNPAALAQMFISGQMGTVQTVIPSLQQAAMDTITGVQTLPATFGAASQFLLAGDPIDAYGALNTGLLNAFLPGFNGVVGQLVVGVGVSITITPIGPLGDLAPIFTIPGQMAQNFTNLLPPGSILAQMAQNGTNLVETVTNFGTALNIDSGVLSLGLPLQAVFDGIGGPANALSALNSSGVAFAGAMQTGNVPGAVAAILDAPANMANGFLNGSTLITLPTATTPLFPGFDIFANVQIPLGGILTPLSQPLLLESSTDSPTPVLTSLSPGTTEFGGLIPGLLTFGPELASAITPTT